MKALCSMSQGKCKSWDGIACAAKTPRMTVGRLVAGYNSAVAMRIKQIIVRRPGGYRQSHEKLIKRAANPITVSPDRYPTGLASSAAGSFPRVGRT
jgi:hypothetical protein